MNSNLCAISTRPRGHPEWVPYSLSCELIPCADGVLKKARSPLGAVAIQGGPRIRSVAHSYLAQMAFCAKHDLHLAPGPSRVVSVFALLRVYSLREWRFEKSTIATRPRGRPEWTPYSFRCAFMSCADGVLRKAQSPPGPVATQGGFRIRSVANLLPSRMAF